MLVTTAEIFCTINYRSNCTIIEVSYKCKRIIDYIELPDIL